jgi:aminopeptidase N
MRIFARASKQKYVDADLVFRVITKGIEFYEKMFDCPFPFAKYDVIYCPEFRISAMENVGAVTFSDRYLIP